MSYIVIDLEWNQAMNTRSSIFNYLPIHLSGEIIQIGAVKLNDDFTPGEEFQSYVKPVYFRSMHYKVKKITGIDKDILSRSETFPIVFEKLKAWCGDDPVFITWGNDDRRIMEQNIIIHDLDWDWIGDWINLQMIFNLQTDRDRNQKALSTAMEHFSIEQTRTAHDALGDAYNTALVCSRLDMVSGLDDYEDASSLLETHIPSAKSEDEEIDCVEHRTFSGYNGRTEIFADEEVRELRCPDCGAVMAPDRWVNQGDRRYMSLVSCPEHGKFLVRLKLRKAWDDSWSANRIIYRADPEMERYYKEKAAQRRKRSRSRRSGKHPAT